MKSFILMIMIFLHIIDDYGLQQGILASMKQKDWWKENAPNPLYRYDYIMALFMHSFSWTFSISIVPIFFALSNNESWYPILFICNIFIHMFVDDLKANKKKINLITDQCIHLLQIIITWFLIIFL